jgi:predicted metal-binding membrane protein
MASDRRFIGASSAVFAASLAATLGWCLSMRGMGEMPMAGGSWISMIWLPMCEETWLHLAASFVVMWTVMMMAMMLPSLVPILMRYRHAAGVSGEPLIGWHTALMATGYFSAWAMLGAAMFPLGAAVAWMQARSLAVAHTAPMGAGLVVIAAGALQLTAWKARRLACCRHFQTGYRTRVTGAATAWRRGMQLGLCCIQCCAGQTATLLVLGVMDLRVMAAVTVAIAVERLAPAGLQSARVTGFVMMVGGAVMMFRGI